MMLTGMISKSNHNHHNEDALGSGSGGSGSGGSGSGLGRYVRLTLSMVITKDNIKMINNNKFRTNSLLTIYYMVVKLLGCFTSTVSI